jgi:hypothetical protein
VVAITATNSATPSLQATLTRSRLEQARREADRAETTAQTLRSEADQAELDAQKGQQNVRELTVRTKQVDSTYASQFKGSGEVPAQTQDFLERMYSATSSKFAASGNALKTQPDAAPVVNTRGQSTGRILNIKT